MTFGPFGRTTFRAQRRPKYRDEDFIAGVTLVQSPRMVENYHDVTRGSKSVTR